MSAFKETSLKAHSAIVAFIVAVTGMIMYEQGPPVTYLSGDSVEPSSMHAGDEVTVTRSFRVDRPGNGVIVRSLVRGDCKLQCDNVDLPTTTRYFGPPGIYTNRRKLTIPRAVEPGDWRLVVTVEWEDRFGRRRVTVLQDLPIKVLA